MCESVRMIDLWQEFGNTYLVQHVVSHNQRVVSNHSLPPILSAPHLSPFTAPDGWVMPRKSVCYLWHLEILSELNDFTDQSTPNKDKLLIESGLRANIEIPQILILSRSKSFETGSDCSEKLSVPKVKFYLIVLLISMPPIMETCNYHWLATKLHLRRLRSDWMATVINLEETTKREISALLLLQLGGSVVDRVRCVPCTHFTCMYGVCCNKRVRDVL